MNFMDFEYNFNDSTTTPTSSINFLSYFLFFIAALNFFIKYILPIIILVYLIIINHNIKSMKKIFKQYIFVSSTEKSDINTNISN